MAKFITFSRVFPVYHPKKGQPTFFVEKICKSIDMLQSSAIHIVDSKVYSECLPKHHTIRSGNRWKAGDYFSPRVWGNDINPKTGRSGPYQSKMITIAPDIKIEKVWQFDTMNDSVLINGFYYCNMKDEERMLKLAQNDGLAIQELLDWFKYPKHVTNHQIICWNKEVEY